MGINEKFLRDANYTQGSDGIWRKEDSIPKDTASRSNPKPSKKRTLQKDSQLEGSAVRRIIALITVKTVRTRDYDGLPTSTKYYMDAISHIGLIKDDSPKYFEPVYAIEKCNHFEEEETIIELFELPR